MKRKRFHDNGVSNNQKYTSHTNENISTAVKRDEQIRCQVRRPQMENVTVPLPSIFKRLYECVSKHPGTTPIDPCNEQISVTPETPKNESKRFQGNLYTT